MWYVYILQAGDGRLYTGCTTDLQRRMAQHRAGAGGGLYEGLWGRGAALSRSLPNPFPGVAAGGSD